MKIPWAKLGGFATSLVGLPVTHVWRGHGSALFLEFGKLEPALRPNGKKLQPMGKMGLMIQWSWRIENANSIICGSWSDEAKWTKTFAKLRKTKVMDVSLFSRLPEIDIELSNNMHVVSFSTTDGDPQWVIFNRENGTSIGVEKGRLYMEASL